MAPLHLLPILASFTLPVPPPAVDLSAIDRAVAKEPAYQTRLPKYCLLAVGPDAKTRVWLVLDGTTLFIDRTGDGDLTPPDKRVTATARDAYVSLVTDSTLPADTTVAMTHLQAADQGSGPTYVMERRAGEWRYLVLDARGLIEREGAPECAGCHAGAVAEGLFGLPRPKETPSKPRE